MVCTCCILHVCRFVKLISQFAAFPHGIYGWLGFIARHVVSRRPRNSLIKMLSFVSFLLAYNEEELTSNYSIKCQQYKCQYSCLIGQLFRLIDLQCNNDCLVVRRKARNYIVIMLWTSIFCWLIDCLIHPIVIQSHRCFYSDERSLHKLIP